MRENRVTLENQVILKSLEKKTRNKYILYIIMQINQDKFIYAVIV